jgi:hypothetical protein
MSQQFATKDVNAQPIASVTSTTTVACIRKDDIYGYVDSGGHGLP